MGRISIDICKEANRTTRTTWPDILEVHGIQEITLTQVRQWANECPRIRELHLFAGFPRVHLSSVRAFRQNLQGEGSNLFWVLLRLMSWLYEVFSPYCKVKFCIENVASMDGKARREISAELQVNPIKLDPSDTLPFNRPRLAWTSEVVEAAQGLELWTEKEYVRAFVLEGSLSDAQWVTPGWVRGNSEAKLPIFMKAIRRSRPPPVPAGIARTSARTRQLWQDDGYRFPPYQYGPDFLFHKANEVDRVANSSERELLLGYGSGHTESARSASEIKQNKAAFEDVRKTLCGDSFAVSSFAIIAGVMAQEFVPRMSPGHIINRLGLAPGTSAHPSMEVPLQRGLAYGAPSGPPASRLQLVKQLGLTMFNS